MCRWFDSGKGHQMLKQLILFLPLTVANWLVSGLAFLLVPVGVLLADNSGRLPKWLQWFETPDALGWGAGTYEPNIYKIYHRFGKRIALIWWLWRNRAYGFAHTVQCQPDFSQCVMHSYGTQGVFKHAPSWWLGTIKQGDKWHFEFAAAVPVGKLFVLGTRCGWKLLPFFQGHRPENYTTSASGIFSGITIRTDSLDGE